MDQKALGIDISRKRLDCYWLHSDKYETYANDTDGINHLITVIRSEDPRWIVFKPKGGNEINLSNKLAKAGIPFSMVETHVLRSFVITNGYASKEDKLDPKIMAIYGKEMNPKPTTFNSKSQQEVFVLVARRRQLIDLLIVELERLEQWEETSIADELKNHCNYLKKNILTLEKQIHTTITQDDTLNGIIKALQGFAGVDPNSVTVLLADLPELGHIRRQEVRALAGVMPFVDVRKGRLSVRCILSRMVLVAIRHNPTIREYFLHLRNQQKPSRVAFVACMGKLLTILNAIAISHLSEGQSFSPPSNDECC